MNVTGNNRGPYDPPPAGMRWAKGPAGIGLRIIKELSMSKNQWYDKIGRPLKLSVRLDLVLSLNIFIMLTPPIVCQNPLISVIWPNYLWDFPIKSY